MSNLIFDNKQFLEVRTFRNTVSRHDRYPSMYLVTISEHYLCCLPAGVQNYVRNQRGVLMYYHAIKILLNKASPVKLKIAINIAWTYLRCIKKLIFEINHENFTHCKLALTKVVLSHVTLQKLHVFYINCAAAIDNKITSK